MTPKLRSEQPRRPARPRGKPVVLVDARAIDASGIGRYLRETLGPLLRDERFGPVHLLGDRVVLREFAEDEHARHPVTVLPAPTTMYSLAAQRAWLDHATHARTAADVAWFPHWDVPVLRFPTHAVVTIHDLIPLRVAGVSTRARRLAMRWMLGHIGRKATTVLVPSQATRHDLAELTPRGAGRAIVTPLGASGRFAAPVAPARPAGDAPYLLVVGNRKPHKNLEAAVETLALARRDCPSLRLVVAGQAWPSWDETLRRAERLGVRDAIVDARVPDDATLHALYAGCAALLVPSRYEGFGLPAIEGMMAGAPVIASNGGSLAEVVGDGGVLVDPDDHRAMADAVVRVIRDEDERERLVRAGRARASRFTWAETARKTADVLLDVAMRGRDAAH